MFGIKKKCNYFIGRLCEDRDPCYANGPCGNNGKCIATVDGNARCECNSGFSGPTCQISILYLIFLNLF